MLVDDELGQGFVVDSQVILQLGGDPRNERQELKALEVVHVGKQEGSRRSRCRCRVNLLAFGVEEVQDAAKLFRSSPFQCLGVSSRTPAKILFTQLQLIQDFDIIFASLSPSQARDLDSCIF